MLVVDDALLLRVLGGRADAAVMAELERGELFTTGVWYHRLSRAVHDDRSLGSLSRELATFDEETEPEKEKNPRWAGVPRVVGTGVDPVTYRFSGGRSAD